MKAQSRPVSTSHLMLSAVRIHRFKAAFKPRGVELRPFTVVIGRNGSGKSTLLEALQWIDQTLRRDAVAACDRYAGVGDLLNLRSQATPNYFQIDCDWAKGRRRLHYLVKVIQDEDGTTPVITNELLEMGAKGKATQTILESSGNSDRLELERTREELALPVREFWRRAVFLRLNPSSLAKGSLPRRSSSDPILDEEGQHLPALLSDLDDEQRKELVRLVTEVLPGIRDVKVPTPQGGRNEHVHYELLEEMPYQGRGGRKRFPIPAWMLSEGTRRITAIFALLVREPAPSLLCIEEIENGLDPWSSRTLVRHLREATGRGIQIIVTTHSPWILDDVELEDIVIVRRRDGNSVYEKFSELWSVKAYSPKIPAGTRYTNLEAESEK